MLRTRLAAAQKVVVPLYAAKDEAEGALRSGLALMAAVLDARTEAKIPLTLCANAVRKVAAGNAANAEALACYAEAHTSLAETRDKLGLKERIAGDWWECEASADEVTAKPDLRVVA